MAEEQQVTAEFDAPDAAGESAIQRLLLCTLAAPSPVEPNLGPWNLDQAVALQQHGIETSILRPVPPIPKWTSRLGHKFARHASRPTSHTVDGIHIQYPSALFHYNTLIRFTLGTHLPGSVATMFAAALGDRLEQVIEQVHPDVLLVHGVMPWYKSVQRATRRFDLPHAYFEHSAREVLRLRRQSRLGRLYRAAAGEARAVITASPHMAEHLRTELSLENVAAVPCGIHSPSEAQRAAPRPAEYRDRLLILCAANYYRRKGFEELIDGFALVADEFPEAHLILVVNEPEHLDSRVARSGVSDRIELRTALPRQELLQWMVWADLFAMPSWGEAFALVYGEAMAAETPILMSTDSGTARFITPFDPGRLEQTSHGWVVPPRDPDAVAAALQQAFTHRDALPTIGRAARQLAERELSWPGHVRKLLRAMNMTPTNSTKPAPTQSDSRTQAAVR